MNRLRTLLSGMDRTDWLLCAVVTAAFGIAFQLVIPRFGWILGAALALLMLARGKKKRDELTVEQEKTAREIKNGEIK